MDLDIKMVKSKGWVMVVVSVTFYSARKKTIDHQPGSELYIFKPIPSNEEE